MQLSELRRRLRTQIGSPTEVDVTNTQLNELINDAMKDVTGRFRFHKARKRCTFLTIAGQSSYGLPVDVEVVMRLWDQTNRKKLEKIGDRQYSSQTNLATTYGIQEKYVRYRDYVELYPTPINDGDVIEVFYKYRQVTLEQESDEPGIPEAWHFGIVMYAAWLYFHTIARDVPKAHDAYEAWKLWVSDKPTEIDEESVDIDSGVEVLPLSQSFDPGQDFNHAD